MPAGTELTEPVPVPTRLTFRLNWGSSDTRPKFAVQVVPFVFRTTLTVIAVPMQAPVHPLKPDPDVGVAVRVMRVFLG